MSVFVACQGGQLAFGWRWPVGWSCAFFPLLSWGRNYATAASSSVKSCVVVVLRRRSRQSVMREVTVKGVTNGLIVCGFRSNFFPPKFFKKKGVRGPLFVS